MEITSPAFPNGEFIPDKYTCAGTDVSPELRIGGVPEGVKSLVIVMDDPDAPGGTFTHWLLWNVSPTTTEIKEDGAMSLLVSGAVLGKTSFGEVGYRGPCPPRGMPHHYHFKLYALAAPLSLQIGSDKYELQSALEKVHILAQVELVGLYSRK